MTNRITNHYFITGTSRGIGKALTEELLKQENARVIGLSRNHTINHRHYEHIAIDLSNAEEVKKYEFPDLDRKDVGRLVLVNNAAILGPVGRLGKQSDKNIITHLQTNLVSVLLLTNKFIKKFQNHSSSDKIILNISSGAGHIPIDAWAMYCVSKAGIDMMSRVIEVEQQQRVKYPFKIYSVAPGIIDTAMQDEIRKVSPKEFNRVGDFIKYKKENLLKSPEQTAKELVELIHSGSKDVIISF